VLRNRLIKRLLGIKQVKAIDEKSDLPRRIDVMLREKLFEVEAPEEEKFIDVSLIEKTFVDANVCAASALLSAGLCTVVDVTDRGDGKAIEVEKIVCFRYAKASALARPKLFGLYRTYRSGNRGGAPLSLSGPSVRDDVKK
jgi:hypothetical protein